MAKMPRITKLCTRFSKQLFYLFAVFFVIVGTTGAGNDAPAATLKAPSVAFLFGGNVVGESGQANAGDQAGRGVATVMIDPSKKLLCFGIVVMGIGTPTAAHIHKAGPGVNGPIVVTLTPPLTGNSASSGCVSGLSPALLNSIKSGPAGYAVYVHTEDFPSGSIRGQLF